MKKKTVVILGLLGAALMLNLSCGTPEVKTEPVDIKKPAPPVKPSGFVKRSFHSAMQEEMKLSFVHADEIIIGIFSGSRTNDSGLTTYYFDNYSTFDKETLTWDSPMNVLLPVFAKQMKPDVITEGDFKRLSPEDRIGICWDPDKDVRYIYLVEGKYSLLFLSSSFDEQTTVNNRYLLDTYPVTDTCNAKLVFDMMVADLTAR